MRLFGERTGKMVLYCDCFAGIAGDMFLASLVDMTGAEDHLRGELGGMAAGNFRMNFTRDLRGGISGLALDVSPGEGHHHRCLDEVSEIINSGGMSEKVKKTAVKAFAMLAEAEGKVHGIPSDEVHFHEVGAIDSIVDIVGAAIMVEYLGWPEVRFSPLNVGSGTVKCAHGTLPVPAPAAAELLRGMEIFASGDPLERVTPTGALLVKLFSGHTSEMPRGRMVKTGIGLGAAAGDPPNMLRSILFDTAQPSQGGGAVCELAANIDDMTPEDLSIAMERLFSAGALDVWFESIQMKKNRPAVKLCCLCGRSDADALASVVLRETSTLGVRRAELSRYTLGRKIETAHTKYGDVRVKTALAQDGSVIRRMPEFDDIKKIADENNITAAEVRAAAGRCVAE